MNTKTNRQKTTLWTDTGMGKLPPQDIEIEETILGSCLIDAAGPELALERLKPEDFYKEVHQYLFAAIADLHTKNQPVDIRTVTNRLRQMGKLELVGGASFVAELTNRVYSSAHIEAHSAVVKEHSLKRRLINLGSTAIRNGYDDTFDAFELLQETELNLMGISGLISRSVRKSFAQQQLDAFKEDELANKRGFIGVPSKYAELTRLTGGYEKGGVYVVAARPGMGKSLFMVNEAINMILLGYSVAIFSLEMTARKQIHRIWSLCTGILHERIKKTLYHNDPAELLQIQNCIQRLDQLKFSLIDTPVINAAEIRSEARRIKRERGLDAIFVDYLGLLELKDNGRNQKADQLAETTRQLKVMAGELEVPVIELSQLSRECEKRGGDKKPILSDLRDSGAVEQDADNVYFLYRPEYYSIKVDAHGNSTEGLNQVIVAKVRDGKLGTIDLSFKPEVSLIEDYQPKFRNQLSIANAEPPTQDLPF